MYLRKAGLLFLSLACCFFSFVATVRFSPPKYSACHSKDFGHGGTVCVCSDEHGCDAFSEGSPLSEQEYAVYTSSKTGDRFNLRTGKVKKPGFSRKLQHSAEVEVKFVVNQDEVFQTILGIGGSFYRFSIVILCRVVISLFQKIIIESLRFNSKIDNFYLGVFTTKLPKTNGLKFFN